MKKYLLPVLTIVLCLNATGAYAQAKKETGQEKILRLEIENKVLNERIIKLEQQLAEAKRANIPTVKPYYANEEIQKNCEKWPKCAAWAAKMHKYFAKSKVEFKILKAKETYEYKSNLFGNNEWVYCLSLDTNLSQFMTKYIRTGEDKNPNSWHDEWVLPDIYKF